MKQILPFLLFFSALAIGHSQDVVLPTITTTGEALVYAAPDEIVLSFSVESYDEVVTKAKEKNKLLSQKAIKFLKEQGISDQHIQSQYLFVSPRFKRHSDRTKAIDYFAATQRIEICIQKISGYELIVEGLLERGVYTISGATFRTTKLKEFKNKARKKAIRNAKEKAKLLAAELGQEVKKAYEIKEIVNSRSSNNQSAYGSSEVVVTANEGEDWSFAPGQLEVRAKVEVRFHLK